MRSIVRRDTPKRAAKPRERVGAGASVFDERHRSGLPHGKILRPDRAELKDRAVQKLVSALSAGAGMGMVARRIRRAEVPCGMLKYAIMLAFVISIGWFLTTLPLAQPYLSCLKTPVPDPNQDGFAAEFKRSVQCERMAFTDKLVRAF
jgi:hypothetical protein